MPRYISLLSITALVAVASSVFLLPQNTSALEPTNSLIQNRIVLEQAKNHLDSKAVELKKIQDKAEAIELKKKQIADQLESDKAEIEELNKKIQEKKAAEEAERIRAESAARTNATQPVAISYATPVSYAPVGNSSGNGYAAGYCTWYAKNRRPDLPNNLGNADTWYARAASMGLSVGSAPVAGAIGQAVGQMHVVYVEAVNGDTVTISEMNYSGLYSMNTRTAPASSFVYIY